jgi:hypothetical protein
MNEELEKQAKACHEAHCPDCIVADPTLDQCRECVLTDKWARNEVGRPFKE